MRGLITLVCGLLFAGPYLAQDTAFLTVHVKDPDGRPMEHVDVLLSKVVHVGFTDASGRAEFPKLDADEYAVIVHKGGYPMWSLYGVGVEAGERATVPVTLGGEQTEAVVHYDSLEDAAASGYQKFLEAMQEPKLCDAVPPDAGERYRFLWLRTFHAPILVRLDLRPNGVGEVHVKVTSGQGGYEPGELVRNEKRPLSSEHIEHFFLTVKEVDFWEMPTRIETPGLIGLDGAQWITEGSRDGKCHVVSRWSPEPSLYRELGLYFLLNLGELKLLYHEVY